MNQINFNIINSNMIMLDHSYVLNERVILITIYIYIHITKYELNEQNFILFENTLFTSKTLNIFNTFPQ